MTERLAVETLSAGYGALEVVSDVSLEVRAGELVGLLGRNGAGKTTTLLAVAGVLKRHRGSIRCGDRDLSGRTAASIARHGVAMVPAGHRIFRQLTVEENLRVGAFLRRRSHGGWKHDLDRVHELFPILAARRHQAGGSLSGGEQQMVAIAQALLARPRFLLLDEPSFGLAPAVVDQIYRVLAQLAGDGLGVLVVEQEIERALRRSDRIYLMEGGRVVRQAPATELSADDVAAVIVGGVEGGPAGSTP